MRTSKVGTINSHLISTLEYKSSLRIGVQNLFCDYYTQPDLVKCLEHICVGPLYSFLEASLDEESHSFVENSSSTS